MNVFNKVTLQSLKENKTRTIVTIIGIILSAAMICAVTTFVSSLMNYALRTAIYSDGNWHGRELGVAYETYEDVCSSKDIEATVYLQQLGYAFADGCENEFKPYIYLLGAGREVESVWPIHITSGNYPTSSNEILLPEHLYTNGGVKYNIGDTLTLELGERMLDGYVMTQNNSCYIYENGDEVFNGEILETQETRTYTVVGFYERLNFEMEESTAPGYTAITLADTEPSANYLYDVYFRMKNPKEVYSFMEKMDFTGSQNTRVLMYLGTSRFHSFSVMLYSLAAIVIGLIMFGSISLIYNAFSISVSERTKQFGLLSSIGATKKQLRRMVLFEALVVSVIGIPLGVFAGVGGIGVTLMLIGDKFRSMGFPIDMKLSVSPVAILIAAAVALITVLISAQIPSKRASKVSAVEAIRQNLDVNVKGRNVKTSKWMYKIFGLSGMLANKYYKRSRKKYRATVFSLFMSIVLFVSASAFTDYLMEAVSGGFSSAAYDLSFRISDDEVEDISKDKLLEQIGSAKSVSKASYFRQCFVNLEISDKYLTKEAIQFLDANQLPNEDTLLRNLNSCIAFVDDTTYKALLKEYGLREQDYINPQNPLAIVVDGVISFNVDKQRYETISFLSSEECAFTCQRQKNIEGYTYYGEIEDGMVRYVEDSDKEYEERKYLDVPLEEAYVNTTLKTGKVISERPYFISDSYEMWLLYPMSLAKVAFEGLDIENNVYCYVASSSNHTESYTAVQTILNDNGFNGKNLLDIAEREEEERNIVTIIRVFSYGFIVLISLIAAANVFNTISTNISLRRREFAMLKSVGMTSKGFNKMMNYECLLYGSRALLLGLPVSCVITFQIYLAIMNGFETTFHLPWGAIGIAVLSVFLVVFVTMMYSMRKIKKDNPINALKNENL